jgi:site-specific DNA-methyltransferase (adenine-specific)
VAWQRDVLRACWRVLAPGGAIFYNHRPRIVHKSLWFPLELNPGLPLRQIIIWDRMEGVGLGDGHFCPMYEWIMVFAGEGFRLVDRGASARGDVWRLRGVRDPSGHPAPFPVGLPERALLATGARTVLDPFAGTGATLRAAMNLHRRAIGVEIEGRWCRAAVERLAQGVLPGWSGAAAGG